MDRELMDQPTLSRLVAHIKSEFSKFAKHTEIPSKVSELKNDSGYLTEHQDISGKADKTYVDDELKKKHGAEPIWEMVLDTVLTENVADFVHTLPDNCVGVRITIHAPADKALPAGTVFPRYKAIWIRQCYVSGYAANTAKDKFIRAEWKQENGDYVYLCETKTGASNYTASRPISVPERFDKDEFYSYPVSKYPTLTDISYRGATLQAGTKIKIWGLVK